MLIENQEVAVRWNNANKAHYVELGYHFTKNKDEFVVNVLDLPKSYSVLVKVVCDYCGKEYYPSYKNYMNNKQEGKDCCSKCRGKKAKETMKSKYGVSHYAKTEEFKQRVKDTCYDKYGAYNPSQVESFQNKKKETNLKRYGAEWYTASDKFVSNCMETYGETNPMKSKDIQNKATSTLIKNGNVPISSEELKLIDILANHYGKSNCHPTYQLGRLTMDCLLTLDDLKIDVEYDGYYWHKNRKQYDRARDEVLKREGYKILRIVSKGKMPTIQQIEEAVEYLKNKEHEFSKILVDL